MYAVAFFMRVVLVDTGMTFEVPLVPLAARLAELLDAFIIFYELVEADPMAAAFPPRSFECSIEDASLTLVLADCLLLFKMLN